MSCPAHEIARGKGTLTSEEIDCLIGVAQGLPSGIVKVYDLGSGVGTTALAVMQGRQSAIEVVSIDNRPDEIYWVGIAMQNIGREADWHGIVGNVLDKNIVPAEGSIDLLIVDVDGVDLADILEIWKPSISFNGNIWHNGRLIGGVISTENKFVETEEEPNAEEQEQTEEGEETETEKVEPSTEDDVRHTTQIGKSWSAEEEEDERPPCKNCGYLPPAEKSYVHAMRAHERIHNQ